VNLVATGTYGNAKDPSSKDITTAVTWTSSAPAVATVSSSGVVTAVSAGTATISATAKGYTGSVSGTTTITPSGTSGSGPLQSITVYPSSETTGNLQGTGQFLAYGTFTTPPYQMDITNGISHIGFGGCTADPCPLIPITTWISDAETLFPVSTSGATGADAGLVTAYASGNADIYVTVKEPNGSLVLSNQVTFNCPLVNPTIDPTTHQITDVGTCNYLTIASPLLVTLTVFNTGLNTTNWLITASSATGTPDVINCGGTAMNATLCTTTYPVGTTVTLTAPAESGVAFGGWSDNCENIGTITAVGPNSCTVYLGKTDPKTGYPSSNVSVGAIFN